ncbi:MAG: DUF1800 family protein [Bacteroidetes bacterium]|nr:DUF1800 family protein [Bacteroidota bacterium]
MDRREFFTPLTQAVKSVAAPAPSHIEQTSSTHKVNRGLSTGITAYTGNWGYDQVAHLLRRTMFGATIDDINYFMGKTMNEAVDELLTAPSSQPDPPINAYNVTGKVDPTVAAGATWVNSPEDPNYNPQRVLSLKEWWVDVMIKQNRSIQEKMVIFWHNHFSTEINVYNSSLLAYRHNVLLGACCADAR